MVRCVSGPSGGGRLDLGHRGSRNWAPWSSRLEFPHAGGDS